MPTDKKEDQVKKGLDDIKRTYDRNMQAVNYYSQNSQIGGKDQATYQSLEDKKRAEVQDKMKKELKAQLKELQPDIRSEVERKLAQDENGKKILEAAGRVQQAGHRQGLFDRAKPLPAESTRHVSSQRNRK